MGTHLCLRDRGGRVWKLCSECATLVVFSREDNTASEVSYLLQHEGTQLFSSISGVMVL